MCLSPLTIPNSSSYKNINLSFHAYKCSCYDCLECQQQRKNDWQVRLGYEIKDFYSRGGVGVFLTFTYRPKCLPTIRVFHAGQYFEVPAFNHDDVLAFLNRLKVWANKIYGKGSYKYFFVSEYGKTTSRPHYHCLFLLEPYVDYKAFVRKCRSSWTYGHTLPFFNPKDGLFYGKKNRVVDPRIKDQHGMSKYITKYIVKDLDFYGHPLLREALLSKEFKFSVRKFLPKHWQSNGLGTHLILKKFNGASDGTIRRLLTLGIAHPYDIKRTVSLPKAVINKLLYRNVRSSRIGRNGKPLYDRYLTPFSRKYLKVIFANNVKKLEENMSQLFQYLHFDGSHGCVSNPHTFRTAALLKLVWRYAPRSAAFRALSLHCGDTIAFQDTDCAFEVWFKNKDTKYLKKHQSSAIAVEQHKQFIAFSFLPRELLPVHDIELLNLYEHELIQVNKSAYLSNAKFMQTLAEDRRKYHSNYPTNIC